LIGLLASVLTARLAFGRKEPRGCEHKFIFIKTKKTAGTAIEVALSELCGPLDVITSYREGSEEQRRGRGPQNYPIEHPLKPARPLWRTARAPLSSKRRLLRAHARLARAYVGETAIPGIGRCLLQDQIEMAAAELRALHAQPLRRSVTKLAMAELNHMLRS
jgi:hypothetical protein